ncbi:MAG: hypothetical protein HYX40_04365 [Sphingobacteriales bacterium]|nr:hypothetical protein [Sphingobacteriales bacterium]
MNKQLINRYWWLPVLFAGTGLSSFTLFTIDDPGSGAPPQKKFNNYYYVHVKDSIPDEKTSDKDEEDWGVGFKTCELDKAIAEMENTIARAKTELKTKDWKKVELQMQEAMKEIEKIDMTKIKMDMEESLNKIDWERMEKEIKKSLKDLQETELPKMKKEMQENLSKQFEGSEKQIAQSKEELLMQKGKINSEWGKGFAETMKNLDKTLLDAKEQLKEFKIMSEELQKDGLIKKGENADIKYKNGELYLTAKNNPKK